MAVELDSEEHALKGSGRARADQSSNREAYARLRRLYSLSRAVPEALKCFRKLSNARQAIFFGGAPGDDLLCTTLLHEYAVRGAGPTALLTQHSSLFEGNPDDVRIIKVKPHEPGEHARTLLRLAGRSILMPTYTDRDWDDDRDSVPSEHIIAAMCRKASLRGEVSLRPYMFLSSAEVAAGRLDSRQAVIQTSGASALWPMRNKEWFEDRFQAVADAIKDDFHLIQIGMESDPPVRGARDLRGRTTMREAAALLANSVVFVGLVGFLMHLARAVDCRSVIIYGGREKPWQSGYVSNINLTGDTLCSPCWRWNTCDYDHECMRMISAESVVQAVFAQAQRHGSALQCQTAQL